MRRGSQGEGLTHPRPRPAQALGIESLASFVRLGLRFFFKNKSFHSFTSQMISHFEFTPPQNPYPTPSLSSLTFASMRVLHPLSCPRVSNLHRTRASPPIAVRQGHPLLHMYLEPWLPPCTLLGWWSSPWEHWVIWPADVVLPMGLQTPSTPPVLLPAPPPGSLSSV